MYSAASRDRDLATYAKRIRWIIERKDFNDFWPVGLPPAGRALGDQLVTAVEAGLARGHRREVPNPTAALILLFFSVHGMRVAGWARERRLAYASAVLEVVEASRRSPLEDPGHRLQGRSDAFAWQPATPEWIASLGRFCALAWACSEALYFCNHRIGTERHGPYAPARGDGMVMIRSTYDLAPRALWPEVEEWPALPRVQAGFEYSGGEARFDLFANPLFEFDARAATARVGVLADREPVDDPRRVDEWSAQLRSLVTGLTARVDEMSFGERALRLHNVMLYAASTVLGAPVALQPGAVVGAGAEVRGSVDELVRYYDVREDVDA